MATTQAATSRVDPAKWLVIVRRWCPAAPVEIAITLVKSLIEAAESGSSGQLRLGLLEDFVLGLDAQLCSNAQKIDKLKKETVRMAADPLRRPKLRPGHPAELARAALAAVQRAPDQVLSVEKIHTALRRVKPKIRRTSTYALVKRMTDCGWFERDFAGVYGLPSRTRKPYEARTLQLLRLVYTAPGHEMGTAEARAVLGWPPKLLSATASELCSRKLLVKPGKVPCKAFRVPAEIVDKLERGEGILIAPGKVFYARPGGPPVDHSALVTLRPERPRVDPAKRAAEVSRLAALTEKEYAAEREVVAKAWGLDDVGMLDLMVVPAREQGNAVPPQAVTSAAQRRTLKLAAREKCLKWYIGLIQTHPDGPHKPRDELLKEAALEFHLPRDDIRSCRAEAIRQTKNPNWSAPGRPGD
jgi:hypothetical protein